MARQVFGKAGLDDDERELQTRGLRHSIAQVCELVSFRMHAGLFLQSVGLFYRGCRGSAARARHGRRSLFAISRSLLLRMPRQCREGHERMQHPIRDKYVSSFLCVLLCVLTSIEDLPC